MNEPALEQARQQLDSAQHVLITSHIRPDGDAVGSVIGLGLALQAVGKQVQMVLADVVPSTFRDLPGADQVRTHPDGKVNLIVVLDSSDLDRVGDMIPEDAVPDLNIDHHVTNINFAKVNLVDTEAVATAAILAEVLPVWGLPITQPIAKVLLAGIITDTLGFRTSNMSPKALRIAADLVDTGVDLSKLYRQVLLQRSFESARYWGAGLGRIQRDGPVVWTSLTQQDRQVAGYPGRDDADLINYMATIEECKVAVIFVEQPSGRIKISWRSRPEVDVSQIALQFGGGGHPPAAGAELEGDLESVKTKVLEATLGLVAPQEREIRML
jgi:phosphoesterase RecJ-like protein